MTQQGRLQLLSGIFIAGLIAANLLGTKITTLLGVSVSIGIFAYPLTFMITDIISEVKGKEYSRQLVNAGLIALYQVTEKFDVGFLYTLIIPYWLFKIAMALLDTPFVYLGARWLRSGEEKA
ncbi:MAG: VUT family protein [Patescibacteria group bacterium]|jgi:uncharacterized PurR-regulated membrane protein YhhQ (DUF165 family)